MKASIDKAQLLQDSIALTELVLLRQWRRAEEFVASRPQVFRARMHVPENDGGDSHDAPFLNEAVLNAPLHCIKAFLDAGAPLEGRDSKQRTPLLLALERISREQASAQSLEILQLLLDRGARADVVDKDGESPIYSSAAQRQPSLVQALIDRGAALDTCRRGGDGRSSLSRLISDYLVIGNPGRLLAIEAIVRGGVDLNRQESSIYETPLALALWAGKIALADLMLAHGADLLIRDDRGQSLLFPARKAPSMQWLLDKAPALLEARDHQGTSPLAHHVQRAFKTQGKDNNDHDDSVAVTCTLIRHGADLDAIDNQGPLLSRTPRELIEEGSCEPLKEFLRSWQAQLAAHAALRDAAPRP